MEHLKGKQLVLCGGVEAVDYGPKLNKRVKCPFDLLDRDQLASGDF